MVGALLKDGSDPNAQSESERSPMEFVVNATTLTWWPPARSTGGAKDAAVLEVLQGRVIFVEHLLEVSEGALPDFLVAGSLAVEVPDDDDLRLVAHRHVGVGLLRTLRRTFQDLELEPERRVHPHLPDLFGLALRPGDLGPDLHRVPFLLQDLLAQDRLMLMALGILDILPNLLDRGVEDAVVSHVYHAYFFWDADDVPASLYLVYYLKAVGKDSIPQAWECPFESNAQSMVRWAMNTRAGEPGLLLSKVEHAKSGHAGIPNFHVVSVTASTLREFDPLPRSAGLNRMTSPGRPARTRAANHSSPHPCR